tara:strand:+ start:1769 stop:1954 length:186 start_codon:yes stop_codon:yes gene_type:complete
MTKNLWQKERKQIFKELTLQYQNEGYDSKTSRRLAKEELQDMLADQNQFIQNIQNDIDEYN